MKLIAIITLFSISITTFAAENDILTKLKNTPASQYEISSLTLDIVAELITMRLPKDKYDRRFKGPDYTFTHLNYSSSTEDNQLVFIANLKGQSKYLTPQNCSKIKDKILKILPVSAVAKLIFRSLDGEDLKQAENLINYKAIIIAEENEAFAIDC